MQTMAERFNFVEDRLERVKTRIEGLRAVIAEEIQRALVNPLEKLKELKHTGSVENYVAEFQLYSSQCELLPEQKLLGYFISGLRHDIRSRVRSNHATVNWRCSGHVMLSGSLLRSRVQVTKWVQTLGLVRRSSRWLIKKMMVKVI